MSRKVLAVLSLLRWAVRRWNPVHAGCTFKGVCRVPKCFTVGDQGEPFLPHLVVCGLFNHYICGARHISMGCLDLLLVVGCSALYGADHSLTSVFPLRLDSASTYNLLVIPPWVYLPVTFLTSSISVSFGW